jgi:uncharacterized membrane protein YdbT with pleckstrin-like domain
MNYVDQNLLPGESILFSAKRHWMCFAYSAVGALISLALLCTELKGVGLFVFLAFSIPAGVIAYIDFVSSEFVVTNKRVIAKVGVIQRSSVELMLSKIEGFQVEQGILGRIFDYGTVVASGTGSTKSPFSLISQPAKIRRCVYEALDRLAGS